MDLMCIPYNLVVYSLYQLYLWCTLMEYATYICIYILYGNLYRDNFQNKFILLYKMLSINFLILTSWYTLFLHTAQSTLYTVHFNLYTVHCTMYNTSIDSIDNNTMYSVHGIIINTINTSIVICNMQYKMNIYTFIIIYKTTYTLHTYMLI